MINRHLAEVISRSKQAYQVIAVMGPRQSGKTVLVKSQFPDYLYANLESPDVREYALTDPRGFLAQNTHMILDEVQKAPDLLSYIQVIVDENPDKHYVLTGSENLLLSENVSQSLAGRIAIHYLVPLSNQELKQAGLLHQDIFSRMLTGSYPELYSNPDKIPTWYKNYITTYLERDVRNMRSVQDLILFQKFLGLCAGRTGQILNLSSLANDTGITVPTAQDWLSILEASFICFRIMPYHNNFNKRLVKSPKLHFYDSGLVCELLGIDSVTSLQKHPLAGSIFESFVISEIQKNFLNSGKRQLLYFFRDKTGNEIDLVYDQDNIRNLIEIKLGQTFRPEFIKSFDYFDSIAGDSNTQKQVVYGGTESQKRTNFNLNSWREV